MKEDELLRIIIVLLISVFSSDDEVSPCACFLLMLYFEDIFKYALKYKVIWIFPRYSFQLYILCT